jgi:hypothetical protein
MAANRVTIDTNVFVHLFNRQYNDDKHIDRLLGSLVARKVTLCIDKTSRILGEYQIHIVPLFRAASDEDLRIFWLRYFLLDGPKHEEPVDFGDALMVAIRGLIRAAEPSDHVFVYVAVSCDTVLVSNNPRHITNHRNHLRRCARRHGSDTTDFINSRDAVAALDC